MTIMDTIEGGVKSITYEDFAGFEPCWLTDEYKRAEHAEQLARYRAMRDKWTALDILRLDDVSADDRLWLVLREELVDAPILHEFACRCAERALSRVHTPDPRSIAAIKVKRKWLRGECTDAELSAARSAAYEAAMLAMRLTSKSAEAYVVRSATTHAAMHAARPSARRAARSAADFALISAAYKAAMSARWSAADFVLSSAAYEAAMDAAWDAECNWQIAELIEMLEG